MGMGGTQRSVKFVKYLPKYNWEPIVITVRDVLYYAHDESLLDEIRSCKIIRTESLDPLRLLSRIGVRNNKKNSGNSSKTPHLKKYFFNFLNSVITNWFLIPDSKILWLPFAITRSFILIHKYKIKIIYTTSPPQSAHLGGLLLKLITGIQWVADFRDDWTGGESQPCPTKLHLLLNKLLEKFVLKSVDCVIAVCNYLRDSLKKKAGTAIHDKKFLTIMNGYDREDFLGLETLSSYPQFTITHCGSISRVSDPEPFLKATRALFRNNPDLTGQIRIQFFGTDIFGRLKYLFDELKLTQSIRPIQYLPHREALKEVMQSHLLLLTIFKKTGEEIITGKIFEYLASGKPILLISSEGEVARMINSLKRGTVINNSDLEGIQKAITKYHKEFQSGKLNFHKLLSPTQFDREILTGKLANEFSKLIQ